MGNKPGRLSKKERERRDAVRTHAMQESIQQMAVPPVVDSTYSYVPPSNKYDPHEGALVPVVPGPHREVAHSAPPSYEMEYLRRVSVAQLTRDGKPFTKADLMAILYILSGVSPGNLRELRVPDLIAAIRKQVYTPENLERLVAGGISIDM